MKPLPRVAPLLVPLFLALMPPAARAQWGVDGRAVCVQGEDQLGPAMVSDGAGGAIVAWEDPRNGSYDIYVQRLSAAGIAQWAPNGVPLCIAADEQRHPVIATDGAGGAIVAWYDVRNGTHADIYVRRITTAGTVQWSTDGVALCTAADEQLFPAIVSDGAGGAIVAWEDDRSGSTNTDVYAARILSTGTVDAAWPANGRRLSGAADMQQYPVMVSDGAGGAIVAWRDRRGGVTYDIYAQRVLTSGALGSGWPTDGRAVCTAGSNQYDPLIVADGTGGAIVTWEDLRAGASDVYAQRVLSTGTVDLTWPVDGRSICTAAGDQLFPSIATDGAGGAIIVWEDYRADPLASDVYAQRIRSTGSVDPSWPANGRLICGATNDQYDPVVTTDGASGAVIAWHDYRDGSFADIYVQRVGGTGAIDPFWPSDGLVVCHASHNQQLPILISDGGGGAIITWQDFRSAVDYDVYSARAYASGAVAAVPPFFEAPALAQLPPFPNPVRRGSTTLSFELAKEDRIFVEILDSSGRRVRTLSAGRVFPPGVHSLRWDGREESGAIASGGVYFACIRDGASSASRRIVLLP
jgi:hypothetical protein